MRKVRHRFFLFVLLWFVLIVSTIAWGAKPVPVCGDGKCRGDETVDTCPADCAAGSYCGDGVCDAEETSANCPEDCDAPPPPVCNNDGTCNEGEDCISCPSDCASMSTGKPSGRYCCGADTCSTDLCGADCGDPILFYCGDGYIDTGEDCDDGGESTLCDLDCTYRICGDGTVNLTSGEECDDGGETASCDTDCTEVICGDGTLNFSADEECDDGNTVANDGCDVSCMLETPPDPYCGDGNIDSDLGEECDDGNTIPGDGCDASCMLESSTVVPANQFNIGDSIGEGEAADGTIGEAHHETVWSTGYNGGDSVNSLNERFEYVNATDYYENDGSRDPVFNRAVSGDVMADFAGQAGEIVTAAYSSTPPDEAGMITILLGNNDVCAPSLDTMTLPADFEQQYRAGLDELAASELTRYANIHVSGIPAIYWLWNAKRNSFWCRVFAWPFVPCENLLDNPADDCESTAARLDPDTVYPGDGTNCIRRKSFHAKIRDIYNPILENVLQEYVDNGQLPNASYIDIFDVQFEDSHVNGGDCFHPSETGHTLLSEEEWCRSQWGADDNFCTP